MFKPELVKGGKAIPIPYAERWSNQVVEESIVEEARVFSRGEIEGLIEQIAREEKISPGSLEVVQEAYDAEGDLIYLNVGVKDGLARGKGWQSIEYDYFIKGKHGEMIGNVRCTCIMRVFNISQTDKDRGQGSMVAKYESGNWTLHTGVNALVKGPSV